MQSYGLTQLLQRPGCTGVGSHIAMNQAPAAVLNHDEHIQQSKRCSHGGEEITGNDPLSVQAQKSRPSHVSSRPTHRSFRNVLAYRSGRNLNIQLHEQLVGNAFLAPRRILVCHPTNQSLNPAMESMVGRAGTSAARITFIPLGASGSSSRGAPRPWPLASRRIVRVTPARFVLPGQFAAA